MDACSAVPENLGFIGSVSRFVDCRADLLSSGAYGALAAPGSTLSLVLTGLLTIFVALIGYNLLTGRGLDMRSGTLAMVKVGAVLALATSWPAYQILVYNVVTQGPGQIAAEIGRPAALPGADGTLVERLDMADGALQQLAILGAGDPLPSQVASMPPPPMAGFNAFALGGSRILFLLTALGGLVSVRIVAALTLALGPFFIAFLLFDNTRSLFEGWIRVMVGAALAAIGVSVALGLELALLEPWLSGILARRLGGEPLPTVPVELFVLGILFTIVTLAVIAASVRLAAAFRLAAWAHSSVPSSSRESTVSETRALSAASRGAREEERSRAAAMATMLAALPRREAAGRELATGSRTVPQPHPRIVVEGTAGGIGRGLPTGSSFQRRAKARVSASAGRRDKTA